jgi:hypothetical protein
MFGLPGRIRGRRGPAKAAVAVGHAILMICWHLLSTGETYTDLGADYFDQRRSSIARQRRRVAQLEALGHKVTLEPARDLLHSGLRPDGGHAPAPPGRPRPSTTQRFTSQKAVQPESWRARR